MKKLLLLGAGGAAGYILGAKAGTARYEAIKSKATLVKEKAPEWAGKAKDLRDKGRDALPEHISLPGQSETATTGTSSPTTASTKGPHNSASPADLASAGRTTH